MSNIIKQPYVVIKPNGMVDDNDVFIFVWRRFGATVRCTGYVMTLLRRLAIEYKLHFIVIQSRIPIRLTHTQITELEKKYPNFLIPTLCGQPLPPRYFQVPPDDEIAQLGIGNFLNRYATQHKQPFSSRKDMVFWRGHDSSDLRSKFLAFGQSQGYDVQASTQDRLPIDTFVAHKYLPILNGTAIASNAGWILGSGSVPLCVGSIPCWWMDSAVPWIHYVPVANLSEFPKVLETCESMGESIAANARTLAMKVFSVPFQTARTMRNVIVSASQCGIDTSRMWMPT